MDVGIGLSLLLCKLCGRWTLLLSWMHVNGSLFLSWNVYTSVCSYAAIGLRLLILMYATGYPGEILIRALQELVLPLMVFALMSGVFNLRHTQGGWVKLFPLLFRICWRHGAISGPLFMLNVLISRFLLLLTYFCYRRSFCQAWMICLALRN